MGPTDPEEEFTEYPRTRYIIARLAPAPEDESDRDAEIDATENENYEVTEDGSETSEEDARPALINAFEPSSMGLSFLIDPAVQTVSLEISWGDYRRVRNESGHHVWRRTPRRGRVMGVPVATRGPLRPIPLSSVRASEIGVVVEDLDESDVTIEGTVHEVAGYRAVSLFLVNRRRKAAAADREKDERWLYQAELEVRTDGNGDFVAREAATEGVVIEDGELATLELTYRDAPTLAVGHGVAAGWSAPHGYPARCDVVWTEHVPGFEVANMVPTEEGVEGAELDMRALSRISSRRIAEALDPLIARYEDWIGDTTATAGQPPISTVPSLRDAAAASIAHCRTAAARMRVGLRLLESDPQAFEAFRFANRAMWDQRVHSRWAEENRGRGTVEGAPGDFDIPRNRRWRPFQIAFILMTIGGLVDERSPDREFVDLLWFPTGGGKTEAYLGLAAFTLALRRLRGDRHGLSSQAGVSIIMRYTLRLLTVQQFQRAAALICACEAIRVDDEASWGSEPFSIGLWVGQGTTPNSYADSVKALSALNQGKRPRAGSPVQLLSCPRCGTTLSTPRRDRPPRVEPRTYLPDDERKRTVIACTNPTCEFSRRRSGNRGLPVVVVDEEIYRVRPSLLIATVDKLARMPFRGEIQSLFGARSGYSPTYGHLTILHDGKVEGRKVRDEQPAPNLLPPELVIQDELHLISGPLGTMVGIYEAALDFLSGVEADGARVRPKVIASTATIRRAQHQVRQLYGRQLGIFPAGGIDASDSFFAQERAIDPSDDRTAGRLYVGLNAPGSSAKTLLVRTYSVLLATAQAEIDADPEAADGFGTLVGYFNTLRSLGGARRLVDDDIGIYLYYLAQARGLARRHAPLEAQELTSRRASHEIPALLSRLEQRFPRLGSGWPIDVLLATNMVSVGVDIARLGLMVVSGQPKTAAEYIQATSRVGRTTPGLIVTMYSWASARDLSHYERFRSYHSALYRHVEAISVTPFSSRALDRALPAVFSAMARLGDEKLAPPLGASHFDPADEHSERLREMLVGRASEIVGPLEAEKVRQRLLALGDEWGNLARDPVRYSWINTSQAPPNNQRVLIRTLGSDEEGIWDVPSSLREVEAPSAFFLLDDEAAPPSEDRK